LEKLSKIVDRPEEDNIKTLLFGRLIFASIEVIHIELLENHYFTAKEGMH